MLLSAQMFGATGSLIIRNWKKLVVISQKLNIDLSRSLSSHFDFIIAIALIIH
ncbi:hypothetical protein [Nodularia sp. NIES-3585]|uniref:hypothetical protein n=1 Tax=Nodularia sp. NIES-3585 TaxID=1973477 RepID=UPI001595FEBC|nr:hypothetical protein [Nodularia sp. NIES-3585]